MPRKPDPSVDRRIREAAATLLFTKGFDFTMDEVAAVAEVGRASVFRRYATKRDLLLDTLTGFVDASVSIPDTGSLRGDLEVIADDTMVAWKQMGVTAKQMFAEAGRDAGVAEVIRTMMRQRMDRAWVVFDRAFERGELRQDLDLRMVADFVTGFIAYRGLLDLEFPTAQEIVEVVLNGYAPR